MGFVGKILTYCYINKLHKTGVLVLYLAIVKQIISKLNKPGGCMKQFKQKIQEGFTLVEILIVVVIIGILATVAIPTYFSYVEKAYASDAKTQIKNILMNSEIYRQTEGEYPSTIDDMKNGYLDIKKSVELKWGFEIDIAEDGLTGTITATSKEDMSGGADHIVTYNLELGEFTGYGQPGGEDSN